MEILALLAGLWTAFVVVYGGLSARAAFRRQQLEKQQQASIRSQAFTRRSSTDQPVLGGLFSEVDMLRLQIETLRSEMSALSTAPRSEKARLRRYRSGLYTDLPRSLRRQVREVRNFRRPIGV